MNKINLLFTSVGRRVELIRAFKKSAKRLNIDCKIFGTDIDELAPALNDVDKSFIVPKVTDPNYINQLLEICEAEEINAVFPLIDPDITVLSMAEPLFSNLKLKLFVANQNAVKICEDKWQTFHFFKKLGLKTPESWDTDSHPNKNGDFPFFIKPRFGSASENTFKLNSQRDLDFFVDYVPKPIIQQHLSGPEITSDIVCDLDGKVLSIVSRQRIAVRGGEVIKGVTIHNMEIDTACRKIARALPARGPITAQCMMENGVPHWIEINARLGGGVPLALAAGVDVTGILIKIVCGDDLSPLPRFSYRENVYMTRFDDSLFISKAEQNA
jgi:carbamoyl-phosphate synthase large subunit